MILVLGFGRSGYISGLRLSPGKSWHKEPADPSQAVPSCRSGLGRFFQAMRALGHGSRRRQRRQRRRRGRNSKLGHCRARSLLRQARQRGLGRHASNAGGRRRVDGPRTRSGLRYTSRPAAVVTTLGTRRRGRSNRRFGRDIAADVGRDGAAPANPNARAAGGGLEARAARGAGEAREATERLHRLSREVRGRLAQAVEIIVGRALRQGRRGSWRRRAGDRGCAGRGRAEEVLLPPVAAIMRLRVRPLRIVISAWIHQERTRAKNKGPFNYSQGNALQNVVAKVEKHKGLHDVM